MIEFCPICKEKLVYIQGVDSYETICKSCIVINYSLSIGLHSYYIKFANDESKNIDLHDGFGLYGDFDENLTYIRDFNNFGNIIFQTNFIQFSDEQLMSPNKTVSKLLSLRSFL